VSNRPVLRRCARIAVVAFAVLTILPIGASSARAQTAVAVPTGANGVLIVAVPDLNWSDLSAQQTPHLWAFAGRAARGLLVVKSADTVATCADAMTTLGAGNRAKAPRDFDEACITNAPVDPAHWAALRRTNRGQLYGTEPGALADALAAQGLASRPIVGAAAAFAAARSDGSYAPGEPIVRISEYNQLYAGGDRGTELTQLDAQVAPLLNANGLVIVVGAGDRRHGQAGLHVAMAAGGGFSSGRLTSESTGRSPYVELIDVAPTVLSLMDVPKPASMVGEPWRMSKRGTSLTGDLRSFIDTADHARDRAHWGGGVVRVLVGGTAAAGVIGALLLLFDVRRKTPRAFAEAFCYLIGALPVSAYLLQVFPWWRWSFVAASFVIVAIDVVIVIAATVAARRWPPWGGVGVVAVVTSSVLAIDLLTGTHLQLNGFLGDAAVIAGRFHGAGNTDFALFAVAALLTAGVVATVVQRRAWRVGAVLAIGLCALLLDGAPRWGDDLGGVLALAPALAVLVLLVLGVRLTARVWLMVAAVGVVAGLALLGYDAVAGGGHIGRFAGQAGRSGARVTIDRKLAANLSSWHRSDYVATVGFSLLTLALVARGPLRRAVRSAPLLGAAFIAVAVCAVLGGALNDSGVVVPGAAATVAVPLLLAGCLRAQA
jgi:hypothetical protein